MLIKRKEFLAILDALESGVDAAAETKQMANVQFTGYDMATYNEQICVLVPFETDFVASINHKDLTTIISKLDAPEFEMELDGNEMSISTDDTKAGLLVIDLEEIQDSIDAIITQMPNEENGGEWMELPEGFVQAVGLCTPAADKDLSKGTLSCLSAFDDMVVCSDNKRVSTFQMDSPIDTEFLIRAGLASDLVKLDLVKFFISDKLVHFATEDNIIFSTKRIAGDSLYTYLKLFPDFKGVEVVIPDGLKEIINAASVMASNSDTKDMYIRSEGKNLVCTTANERGWIERSVPVDFGKKQKLDIQISSVYLNQILDLPNLKMTLGENSSLFVSGNFKHIIQHKKD
jgi:DNA polymerase III sliding clamp (beta) subunit (PCNA family)